MERAVRRPKFILLDLVFVGGLVTGVLLYLSPGFAWVGKVLLCFFVPVTVLGLIGMGLQRVGILKSDTRRRKN